MDDKLLNQTPPPTPNTPSAPPASTPSVLAPKSAAERLPDPLPTTSALASAASPSPSPVAPIGQDRSPSSAPVSFAENPVIRPAGGKAGAVLNKADQQPNKGKGKLVAGMLAFILVGTAIAGGVFLTKQGGVGELRRRAAEICTSSSVPTGNCEDCGWDNQGQCGVGVSDTCNCNPPNNDPCDLNFEPNGAGGCRVATAPTPTPGEGTGTSGCYEIRNKAADNCSDMFGFEDKQCWPVTDATKCYCPVACIVTWINHCATVPGECFGRVHTCDGNYVGGNSCNNNAGPVINAGEQICAAPACGKTVQADISCTSGQNSYDSVYGGVCTSVPSPTPTPPIETNPTATPPPGTLAAQCVNVVAQKQTGAAWNDVALTALRAGDRVRFVANGSITGPAPQGSFTRGAFFINGTLHESDVTTIDTTHFAVEYTVPSAGGALNVGAVLYHSTLGWVD